MGCDFYLNPPKDQCHVCKGWFEDCFKPHGKWICCSCYIKSLKAEIRRLKKEVKANGTS